MLAFVPTRQAPEATPATQAAAQPVPAAASAAEARATTEPAKAEPSKPEKEAFTCSSTFAALFEGPNKLASISTYITEALSDIAAQLPHPLVC